MGAEQRADEENEPTGPKNRENDVHPRPGAPPLDPLLGAGDEEVEEPFGKVCSGNRRLGAVRRDPRLGEDLLPRRGCHPRPRRLAQACLDPPPPVLAPQEDDEGRVRGKAPRGEHSPGVRRRVRERVVPRREIDER